MFFGQPNPFGLNNFMNFGGGSAMGSFSSPYPGYRVPPALQNTRADDALASFFKTQRRLATHGNAKQAANVDFTEVIRSLQGPNGEWDSATALRLSRSMLSRSTKKLQASRDASRRSLSAEIAKLEKKILENRKAASTGFDEVM